MTNTTTPPSTVVASDWLLPCPVCRGTMYVYAWRADGWTDCTDMHRETADPLAYEQARRDQRARTLPAQHPDRAAH